MTKTIAVIPGDDASPEAVKPTVALIREVLPDIQWTYPPIDGKPSAGQATTLADKGKSLIDNADATLFGSTSGRSSLALRYLRWGKETFANVRPCKHIAGCRSPLRQPEGIDFVIVRENLEDLYVGIEGNLDELAFLDRVGRTGGRQPSEYGDANYALKVISEKGTRRVARFACELALKRNGKRTVTCVTKRNMLPKSDGLFHSIANEVVGQCEGLTFESFIVDDFACRLIREPQRFDVVLMPNLYGDILSDAAGGLLGSLGLAASGCYGDNYAYFEPAHGTAPDIAGTNTINPTATLLSATMMLEYLGHRRTAEKLERCVEDVYAAGQPLTPDQGGIASTTTFVNAVRHRYFAGS